MQVNAQVSTEEIPPRARRRVISAYPEATDLGNTSACAEKSRRGGWGLRCRRKYLRVRGEEYNGRLKIPLVAEIPPCARRRGISQHRQRRGRGNTSACAEKRACRLMRRFRLRKYLRVRGEELSAHTQKRPISEIPPRARRRVDGVVGVCDAAGNTSACAEKSRRGVCRVQIQWKYLRVRGEEVKGFDNGANIMEIPPRARRRARV